MSVTATQLLAIMPTAGERAAIFAPPLNAAFVEFGIDSLGCQAAFIAQIAHESACLRYTAEIWGPTDAQKRYEGRADLGNVAPGDGKRFLGRGLIQVTGRTNTQECLAALSRPAIDWAYLETPVGACRSACWFWKSRGLNDIAERGDFGTLTKRINGGYNGLDERIRYYVRARKVLGL